MNHISIKSYAKINLGLDVLGTLPNGYHELKMIMQTITLSDNLFFEKRKDNRIILKTNLPFLPVNEKNIVYLVHFIALFGILPPKTGTKERRIPRTARGGGSRRGLPF